MGRLRDTNLFKRICGLNRHPCLHRLTGRTRIGVGHMYGRMPRMLAGDVCRPQGITESAQLDRDIRDDLRQARIKTATGNLARAIESSM